jgi:hypothetical protein
VIRQQRREARPGTTVSGQLVFSYGLRARRCI